MLGLLERAAEPGFAQESRRRGRIRRREAGELLQRHRSLEVGLMGEMDDRHPTSPEHAFDSVPADLPHGCLRKWDKILPVDVLDVLRVGREERAVRVRRDLPERLDVPTPCRTRR